MLPGAFWPGNERATLSRSSSAAARVSSCARRAVIQLGRGRLVVLPSACELTLLQLDLPPLGVTFRLQRGDVLAQRTAKSDEAALGLMVAKILGDQIHLHGERRQVRL